MVQIERCTEILPEGLQQFQRRMVGRNSRQADPARAEWLMPCNPYCEDDVPPVWVAQEDGSVVGVQASVPVDLKVGPEVCRASWAIDLVVDPEHRGQGIASSLVRAHQEHSRVEVAFGLSDGGFAIMMQTGATHVGAASAYLFACDERVAAAVAANTRVPRSVARSVAAAPLAGLRALAGSRSRRTTFVPIARFDESVDEIWRAASRDYRVIVPRDLTFLRWRFDESPHRDEYERFYVEHAGRRIGYVVFRESTWRDLPTLEILDYLARPEDLERLFAGSIRFARRRGKAAVICLTLNERARRPLRRLGFLVRRKASRKLRVTVHTEADDPLHATLREGDAYFLTCADSDVDE